MRAHDDPREAVVLTRVVNLRRRSFDIYIGRAGKGTEGYFGNPYAVGRVCQRCGALHDTGASTLPCFEQYFFHRLGTDAEFRIRVRALAGKTLGCFCAPNPCHGDIIARWVNQNEDIDTALGRLLGYARKA